MAVNAIEGFSKYQIMPSLLVFQVVLTAKMTVHFSLSSPTSFALEWISYPTMNSRRSFSAKTKSKWMYCLHSSLILNNSTLLCFQHGRNISSWIIFKISWCRSWWRGRRNVMSWLEKLTKMQLAKSLREVWAILYIISKMWRIKRKLLLYRNSIWPNQDRRWCQNCKK